jgi:hypothetical protein
MRERLILSIANLRSEFDVIGILTPLPRERKPKLEVLTPTDRGDRRRFVAPSNDRKRRARSIR